MFGVTTGNASVGPSPSNTASGHTPGYGGGFTPMTPMDTSTPAAQQPTSFKIKLGGLGGGQ